MKTYIGQATFVSDNSGIFSPEEVKNIVEEIANIPDVSPYDLGRGHGYNDEYLENPYPENSQDYFDYLEGYEQGSNDC